MALLRHIVVGTLDCLLLTGTVIAVPYGGPGDGVSEFKDADTENQSKHLETGGKKSAIIMRGEEWVTVFPFVRPTKLLSETFSGTGNQLTPRDADSEVRSNANETVGDVEDRIWSGQAKERRRRSASTGGNEAFIHRYNGAGFNSKGITPNSSGSVKAGFAQLLTSVPFPLKVNGMYDSSARGVPHPHGSPPETRAAPRSLSESSSSYPDWDEEDAGPVEERLVHMMVTEGFVDSLISDEHYRLLTIKLFEKRARFFRVNFGRYPNDRVFERFFLSAEAGTLEDELKNVATKKLFLYCMHLEARDMSQGYLFSELVTDVVDPRPPDFEATLEMFRQALRDQSLAALLEDEAERYLFYRFYVALGKRVEAQGTTGDLTDVDKYFLSMVNAQVLQAQLERPEGRRHIVEMVISKPGVLNGAPLPPPQTPRPTPFPPGSSTAPPPPADPQPEPSTPDWPSKPPRSAVMPLNVSAWLTLILTIGVVATSV